MGKKDTGYLYKALMDAIRGMMWPAMPSLTACSLDCTCVVGQSANDLQKREGSGMLSLSGKDLRRREAKRQVRDGRTSKNRASSLERSRTAHLAMCEQGQQ